MKKRHSPVLGALLGAEVGGGYADKYLLQKCSLTIQLQPPCILILLDDTASNKLDLLLIPEGIEMFEVTLRI